MPCTTTTGEPTLQHKFVYALETTEGVAATPDGTRFFPAGNFDLSRAATYAPTTTHSGTGMPVQSIRGTNSTSTTITLDLRADNEPMLLAALGTYDQTPVSLPLTDATSTATTIGSVLTDLSVVRPGSHIITTGWLGASIGANGRPLYVLDSSADELTIAPGYATLGVEGPVAIQLDQPQQIWPDICEKRFTLGKEGLDFSELLLGSKLDGFTLTFALNTDPRVVQVSMPVVARSYESSQAGSGYRFFTGTVTPENLLTQAFTCSVFTPGGSGAQDGISRIVFGDQDYSTDPEMLPTDLSIAISQPNAQVGGLRINNDPSGHVIQNTQPVTLTSALVQTATSIPFKAWLESGEFVSFGLVCQQGADQMAITIPGLRVTEGARTDDGGVSGGPFSGMASLEPALGNLPMLTITMFPNTVV